MSRKLLSDPYLAIHDKIMAKNKGRFHVLMKLSAINAFFVLSLKPLNIEIIVKTDTYRSICPGILNRGIV